MPTPSTSEPTIDCPLCGATAACSVHGSVLIGCDECRSGGYWTTRKGLAFFRRGPLNDTQKTAIRTLLKRGVGSEDRPVSHHSIASL